MRTALLLALGACDIPTHPAEVTLEIDGTSRDYRTSSAQWERLGDGPVSVYLLPDDKTSGQPYVNLRYYSGNPVGHVWVRIADTPEQFAEPPKWECFIPGTFSNGTPTLGWKNDDGSDRHSTETGDPDCKATVTEEGGRIVLEVDALVRPAKSKKKSGADEPAEPRRVRARAVVSDHDN